MTLWSFDIVDINEEFMDSCEICIGWSSQSLLDMAIFKGITVYPKALRELMFSLATEISGDGTYPKFNLEYVDVAPDEYLIDYPGTYMLLTADDIESDEDGTSDDDVSE